MVVNQDRLSSLPDDLLFMIVSFLPFKEAVKTAILSKRWRFIPLGTKNLEFMESDFVPTDRDVTNMDKLREAFADFVLDWIVRSGQDNSGSGLNKFSLTFAQPEEHLIKIQQCLRFVISREVDNYEINFSNRNWDDDDIENCCPGTFLQLPSMHENAIKALQSLKLSACNVPEVYQSINQFSQLKSISLGWIFMKKDSSLKNLLKRCPLLENLSMNRCSFPGYSKVSSKRLRCLILEKCCSIHGSTPEIVIKAPEMKIFKYSGVLVSFDFRCLNLDMEASLDFGMEGDFDEYGEMLYQILNQISGVKALIICTYMLQVVPLGEEPLRLRPKLERLKHLILKASLVQEEFYGITFFLNSCPNLENLTIDLNSPRRIFPDYDPPFPFSQHPFFKNSDPFPVVVFSCVKKKLKNVVVDGFKGTASELAVLRYLLKYGRVLESLHVKISNERASDGRSLEDSCIEKVHSLLEFDITNRGIRILLSRPA